MPLRQLTLKDKKLVDNFLSLSQHELSVYAFVNIYIWKGLFEISWAVIKKSLCIFFRDKLGCFLYLPPLSRNLKTEAAEECFRIMDKFNANPAVSRIENVQEKDLGFFRSLGFQAVNKSFDYLCRRMDLVNLTGNRFKSKRAAYNYFRKNYKFKYLAYSANYREDCLKLYQSWRRNRESAYKDKIYQGMLEDNFIALKVFLDNYKNLNCLGRIVKIDRQLKAFTFGFRLNNETFCILYEITDLKIKGLAQYIFRQFCSELKGYKYINIMDDSGLENLKKVKLSYHPQRLIPNFIIRRKNA